MPWWRRWVKGATALINSEGEVMAQNADLPPVSAVKIFGMSRKVGEPKPLRTTLAVVLVLIAILGIGGCHSRAPQRRQLLTQKVNGPSGNKRLSVTARPRRRIHERHRGQ